MVTYPVDYIDKGLGGDPQKTIDHIGDLLIREDRLNEGGELIPGNGTADQIDQALPCLLIGVDTRNGWIGRIVHTPRKIMTR